MNKAHTIACVRQPDLFFRKLISEVAFEQGAELSESVMVYLTFLLSSLVQPRVFRRIAQSECGDRQYNARLADLLGEAQEAPYHDTRIRLMSRIGDTALVIAGFFHASLARSTVRTHYYTGMGQSAFSDASDTARRIRDARADQFQEMAECFSVLLQILRQVARPTHGSKNILHLYELWIQTGDPAVREQLQALGILVSNQDQSTIIH